MILSLVKKSLTKGRVAVQSDAKRCRLDPEYRISLIRTLTRTRMRARVHLSHEKRQSGPLDMDIMIFDHEFSAISLR